MSLTDRYLPPPNHDAQRVLAVLQSMGVDTMGAAESLMNGEHTHATAAYHMLAAQAKGGRPGHPMRTESFQLSESSTAGPGGFR